MTRQEEFARLICSIMNVFMQYPESSLELFGFASFTGAIDSAKRAAKSFTRRAGRRFESAFHDEAEAEALYVVTTLVLTDLPSIKERFPEESSRLVFYRMQCGYALKSYFAHRAKSTISDWKKRGKVQERVELKPEMLMQEDTPWLETYESVVTTKEQDLCIQLKISGMSIQDIASELQMSVTAVNKTIRTVKRRLRR